MGKGGEIAEKSGPACRIIRAQLGCPVMNMDARAVFGRHDGVVERRGGPAENRDRLSAERGKIDGFLRGRPACARKFRAINSGTRPPPLPSIPVANTSVRAHTVCGVRLTSSSHAI